MKILGIVNITPDSFSDGGLYFEPDKAIAHGEELIAQGADILDLGPASTNPNACDVDEEEEKRRLKPVLTALKKQNHQISVDSFLSATQIFSLNQKVDFLNDIRGFADEAIYPQIADSDCQLIIMHSIQHGKADRQSSPDDIFAHVCRFFDDRLERLMKAGISKKRFILDPGMGFFLGNRADASFEILARLGELKARYDLPILISISRKSFLRVATGRDIKQVQAGVLAGELFAILQGVDYIRTHQPAPLRDGFKILERLSAFAS